MAGEVEIKIPIYLPLQFKASILYLFILLYFSISWVEFRDFFFFFWQAKIHAETEVLALEYVPDEILTEAQNQGTKWLSLIWAHPVSMVFQNIKWSHKLLV